MTVNYKFPEIRTINDVLPHIQGRPEFIVAERDFGFVINYVVAMSDTFGTPHIGTKMVPGAKPYFQYDYGDLVRRECRGIIFDTEGKIMSRPFHKFFNVNEKPETQTNLIDISRPHTIMEKMDGSMIRPIWVHDKVRLATKMGVTDIAIESEKLLDQVQLVWLSNMMVDGFTPLFEYISPSNKIVLDYAEPKLVYLGCRHNVTGNYAILLDVPFEMAPTYGSLDRGDLSLDEYIAAARQRQGREGDIIRFVDGHMIKIKNDWYVRIHKTKDLVRVDRNIADIIINEQLDDVIPLLDATDLERVKAYELRFDAAIENVVGRLEGLVTIARVLHGGNKKDLAINFIPNLKYKDDAKFIFAAYDGKDIRTWVIDFIKKSVNNTTKYDELMKWMES